MTTKNTETTTTPKAFCFVLMPFEGAFDDIYKLGIKQSCIDAGTYCERVDEQIFHESILDRIFNQISKADIIIADMTGRNANVFYEVGYAHALGKKTILLTQNSSDIPFDLKHYPHIIYGNKITTLKDELTQRVKWFIDNLNKTDNSYKIDIDIFLGSQNLSNDNVVYITPPKKVPHPNLTIHNKTFRTFEPSDYRLAVITDKNYRKLRTAESKTTELPDGTNFHMLPFFSDLLYPNSYTSLLLTFACENNYKTGQDIIVRLFTNHGTRDYPLRIEFDDEIPKI